ncbi:hypothetical protein DP116_08700 [Brasilonema bromeliae SPC951]|uniref:Filamentous haemagglutinin FhaB/tRNA nuclease CdiA-like TPS domain-containing protein n=2 Tax=Bromeliae group (in: Brasilonema) TaxID=3398495 RepID=A0ABX1P5B4_9CYAN|nr:hypothetical protein [Brasilonema bromeliae SPC951]
MRSNGTPVGENSVVKSKPINNHTINQVNGRANCKANLFNSVKQFSVPTGITTYFNNAADLHNISWVTGKSFFNILNIDGTFQTNGTANLFLFNSDRKLSHSDTFSQFLENNQTQDFLKAIPGQQLVIAQCCTRPGCLCCKC